MINILCGGNSLTAGTGEPNTALHYHAQLAALLGAEYNVEQVGIGGAQTPYLTSIYDTSILPLYDAGATRNIIILWEIINHIALGGATEAQVVQALIDFTTNANLDGWEVIIGTGTMRSSMWMNGVNTTIDDMQNRILAVNADVRLSEVTGSIGYIDFARATYEGNSTLFETKFTNDPGPAPYTDSAHLNGAGYTSMANRAYADLLEVLAGTQGGGGGETPELYIRQRVGGVVKQVPLYLTGDVPVQVGGVTLFLRYAEAGAVRQRVGGIVRRVEQL